MPDNKIQILSTKRLPEILISKALSKNIVITAIPFIETEPLQTIEVQQEIEQAATRSATIIFTSVNAVDAVAAGLENGQPDWNIYCIGHATKESIIAYFGEDRILGEADNAEELAHLIVEENNTGEVIFFCGSQRRTEITEILQADGIDVDEIVVYQTIAVPQKVKVNYNGIVFFSPSAVDSFFKVNRITGNTILFAIGNTTSNRIKKYSENKIIISKKPDKDEMIREVANYFS